MAIAKIYSGEPCILEVVFPSNPFVAYNKDYSDIEEIYMGLKESVIDPDDAYINKYWKDGLGGGLETGDVLYDEATHSFKLVLLETDSIEKGKYFIAIGVKVAGLTKMIWLRQKRDSDNLVLVEQDAVAQ